MIKAACHCGAVRFEIADAPTWVLDCNCTLCRRYGALWSYYQGDDQAKLIAKPRPDSTFTYLWGDKEIATHHCKICGCTTHLQAVNSPGAVIFGVNARMMVGLDPAKVQLRQIDNGHSGYFWTKSGLPVMPSNHPPMPPPAPDDWR
jgi:hypothetical protein